MSTDSRRLSRLSLKDHTGRVHRLHPELCRPKGRFCDESGTISPHAVRVVYMMAGILPPQSDSAEDLFASITQHIMLLNAYIEHSGVPRARKVVVIDTRDASEALAAKESTKPKPKSKTAASAAKASKPSSQKEAQKTE